MARHNRRGSLSDLKRVPPGRVDEAARFLLLEVRQEVRKEVRPPRPAIAPVDDIIRLIRSTRGLSARVARACGIDKAAVYQWKHVPVLRANTVADLLDIDVEKVRPDIFLP
jgi:DNA-binding transcriptional regulator Cro